MNLELLDRAAGATTCGVLAIGGASLVRAGVVGLIGGGAGMVPLTAGAAMLLAYNYGCGSMPLDEAPEGQLEGCTQVATKGALQIKWTDGSVFDAFNQNHYLYTEGQDCQEITMCKIVEVDDRQPWWFDITWRGEDGREYGSYGDYKFESEEDARACKFSIRPFNDDCTGTSDGPPPLPPEMFEPKPYTDPVTNCNFNITFQGFVEQSPGGSVKPVYLLQEGENPPDSGGGGVRAGGGNMGGCSWPDTIFVPSDGGGGSGGGSGGPYYFPVPDGPTPPNGPGGVPWWAAPLLAASTNAALQLIGDSLKDMFETQLPEGSFTLQAPCDVDEEGNPLTQTWTYRKMKYQERSLAHQITMLEALQTHLNWKTPTCSDHEKPELEGTWISTRWESDSNSPASNRPLRKLFRYRSKSTRDAEQLRQYWSDFQWEAGPYCVIHKRAWWGTPQVWAASPEEGKRVIRFAGIEAGIDPDQTGEWAVSSSDSPRYGMPGTMRLEVAGGVRWVTRRDGPSGVPV